MDSVYNQTLTLLLAIFLGGILKALVWDAPLRVLLQQPPVDSRRDGALILLMAAAFLGMVVAGLVWLPSAWVEHSAVGKFLLAFAVLGVSGGSFGLGALIFRRGLWGLALLLYGMAGFTPPYSAQLPRLAGLDPFFVLTLFRSAAGSMSRYP